MIAAEREPQLEARQMPSRHGDAAEITVRRRRPAGNAHSRTQFWKEPFAALQQDRFRLYLLPSRFPGSAIRVGDAEAASPDAVQGLAFHLENWSGR
jgi:hypothetical protein